MSAPSLTIGGEAARAQVRRPASLADAWDERRGQLFVAFVVLAWLLTPIAGFRAVLILLTAAGFAAAIAGLWRPAIGLHGIAILCVLDAGARVFIFTGGLLRYNTFNYWLVIAPSRRDRPEVRRFAEWVQAQAAVTRSMIGE